MEQLSFETLAQVIGVPGAVAIWLLWNSRGKSDNLDRGATVVSQLDRVIEKLDDHSRRMTILEVKLEERTGK